jgi:hypothetical protein
MLRIVAVNEDTRLAHTILVGLLEGELPFSGTILDWILGK